MISSHDLDTVESVCDQVGIIHDGGLVAEDEPENLSRTVGDLETAVLELTDA